MDLKVKIHSTKQAGNVLGKASVNIGNDLALTGITIMNGKHGKFLSFPGYKSRNGEYKDYFFPISKKFRRELSDTVLAKYEMVLKKSQEFAVIEDDEAPNHFTKEQQESDMSM